MNTTKISRTLLAAVLTSGFAIAPLMAPMAQADPPSHAPAYGRRAKDKQARKEERRIERYDRERYDNDRDYRERYDRDERNNRDSASFGGTVTNVRSGNSFDLRANGRTYNIYTSSSIPRGLSKGDEVSVYGRPYGDNDIRNATVRITRNNRNDPRRDDNNDGNRYQNFIGIVTSVRNSREFDVRVGSTTYNVYANNAAPRLSKNDKVRIYGQRSGNNDIRNASVTVTRNR